MDMYSAFVTASVENGARQVPRTSPVPSLARPTGIALAQVIVVIPMTLWVVGMFAYSVFK